MVNTNLATVWDPLVGRLLYSLKHANEVPDKLAQLVKVLSGHQLDLTGAVLPQMPEDLQKTWEGLLPNRPKEFTVSPEDIINWHLREAEARVKEKQWSAAVFIGITSFMPNRTIRPIKTV